MKCMVVAVGWLVSVASRRLELQNSRWIAGLYLPQVCHALRWQKVEVVGDCRRDVLLLMLDELFADDHDDGNAPHMPAALPPWSNSCLCKCYCELDHLLTAAVSWHHSEVVLLRQQTEDRPGAVERDLHRPALVDACR